jgi:enamine deaminase RidA (YjgF/YER057c/UK114 family)
LTRAAAEDGSEHRLLHPAGWPQARGHAHGVLASGRIVFVAGMLGADEHGKFAKGFVAQAKQALHNVVTVVAEAGGLPRHIVRLTWYVCEMDEYLSQRTALGAAYREVMGRHFPVMTVVGVNRLVQREARLEIEATAVVSI